MESAMSDAVTYAVDRFLDQMTISHYPSELLSRTIIAAVSAAARRGVFLEFATFDDFMRINAMNLTSWRPLSTSWRTDVGGVTDETGYVIFGRNLDGDVVATTSAKWLDWTSTNFKIEAESLRFFYANPERDKAPGEKCVVTAPNATEVTGRILHTGGAWYRPDMRGRQLARIVPRAGRAFAGMQWKIDNVCGIISDFNTKSGFDKRTGYRQITKWVTMTNSPSYPGVEVRLVLVGLTGAQLFEYSEYFLSTFETEVDTGVSARRA
jgi:hypothetical protein